MSHKHRLAPQLEALEDRWVPATVRFINGTLLVSNPHITGGSSSLTLTLTGTNTFQVKDGTTTLGTYSGVSNVDVTGSNAKDDITVDLGANTYGGNLFINSGNGNDTILLRATGGSVGGSVTILSGLGNDTVGINSTGTAITVGGPIQVTNQAGNDSIALGNATGVSRFLGDVTLTGMNNVLLGFGQADVFGGNLNVSLATDSLPLNFSTTDTATQVTINGSLNITGGSGDDTVVDSALVVNGNVNINLGSSATAIFGNFVSFNIGSPPIQVGGNFSYSGTGALDELLMGGYKVAGDMSLNVGDGNDLIDLSTEGGLTAPPTVGGNLAITAGNGNDNFNGIFNEGIAAAVNGNVQVLLGNGNDIASVVGPVGGTVSWHSGNGSDALTIGNGAADTNNYNINVQFGNLNDAFTLNIAPTSQLTGSVDGGGRLTANVFNQVSGTLGSPFTLSNFP